MIKRAKCFAKVFPFRLVISVVTVAAVQRNRSHTEEVGKKTRKNGI